MAPPPAYSTSTALVPIFWISFEDELLAGQADGDDQDDRSGADDHAQRGEGKAHLAGAEAVEGQLENLAEHHGAAGAEQRLLEGELAGLFYWIHQFLIHEMIRCIQDAPGRLPGFSQSSGRCRR